MDDSIRVVLMTAAVVLGCGGFARLARRKSQDTYKRGVVLVDGRALQRRAVRMKRSNSKLLTLAGAAIAEADETKHFKLIGTTGTGKSTAIRELLGAAMERGDRAVFADPDGGYLGRFYSRYRGDVVLNPFEPNSVKWDMFAELRNSYDVEQLAAGLIPATEDPSASEWRGYARTFLCAVVRRCLGSGLRNISELWRLLTTASMEELRPIVDGTPAQPFLDPDNARMFGSIRSVTGSAIAALEYIQAQRAAPFSVREWVRSAPAAPGALFIPYKAGQIAALRSIIATWMRLAIFEAMSQPEGRDQRLWFVVDELDALGAIDGLKDALARLRKFGCRCVLGFQSIAQVSCTYGPAAQTIVENCGNTLILRCSASENGGTSQFASRLIGDREILRRQVSRGSDREAALSSRGARRSRNITEQHATEPAVMPSELEQLPDLCGYLKTASSSRWLKVTFTR
jgi:type IV secretory pathway TraG/TraD family ATPase VirD4